MEDTKPAMPEAKIDSMATPEYKAFLIEEAESKLRNIKIILFVLGGIQIAIGLYYYFGLGDYMLVATIIQLIIGLMYLGLGFLVSKKPFIGVVTGFALYALLVISSALLDPKSFFRIFDLQNTAMLTISLGLIFKTLIIIAFIKAIRYAKEVEALRKEMRTLYGNQDGLPIDLIS